MRGRDGACGVLGERGRGSWKKKAGDEDKGGGGDAVHDVSTECRCNIQRFSVVWSSVPRCRHRPDTGELPSAGAITVHLREDRFSCDVTLPDVV